MSLRNAGLGVVLAAASATLALGILEVGLRTFAPQPLLHDPDAFVSDPVLGVRLRAGFSDRFVTPEFSSTWNINRDGYRGPPAGPKDVSRARIAALGDSFTFGYGVEAEAAWPKRLEAALGAGAEVINLGVGGYGTAQATLWLEDRWESLRPDLALLAFYVGNDPTDNARTVASRAPAGSGPGGERNAGLASRTERIKRWLGSRFHLYTLVSTRFDELLVRAGMRELVYPFEMEVLSRNASAEVARAWDATMRALSDLAELSKRRSLRTIVVIVPMRHQVSDEAWERLVLHYGGLDEGRETADDFERDRPQRILVEMCHRLELEVLDLKDGLRASVPPGADPRSLYWPRDQHWSPSGHEAAARLIAGYLRDTGLVFPVPAAR